MPIQCQPMKIMNGWQGNVSHYHLWGVTIPLLEKGNKGAGKGFRWAGGVVPATRRNGRHGCPKWEGLGNQFWVIDLTSPSPQSNHSSPVGI
jgi:hypothetical protein